MKFTCTVFAALLLVTTVAVGQQHASYAEPFPQSANPALANGTAEESSSASSVDLPSSMASRSGTYGHDADLGSPFPQAANPSLGSTSDQMSQDNKRADAGAMVRKLGWLARELPTDHLPMITIPEKLSRMLIEAGNQAFSNPGSGG